MITISSIEIEVLLSGLLWFVVRQLCLTVRNFFFLNIQYQVSNVVYSQYNCLPNVEFGWPAQKKGNSQKVFDSFSELLSWNLLEWRKDWKHRIDHLGYSIVCPLSLNRHKHVSRSKSMKKKQKENQNLSVLKLCSNMKLKRKKKETRKRYWKSVLFPFPVGYIKNSIHNFTFEFRNGTNFFRSAR